MDHAQPRLSRRDAIRLLGTAALVASVAMRSGRRDVGAVRGWCFKDPIFSLDGDVGHVYLAVPDGMESFNKSACAVVIHHPPDAVPALIWIDPVGFGHGITARFKRADHLVTTSEGHQIEVWARVQMTDPTIPVLVSFAPDPGDHVTASVVGRANSWIVLSGVVP